MKTTQITASARALVETSPGIHIVYGLMVRAELDHGENFEKAVVELQNKTDQALDQRIHSVPKQS